MKKMKKMIYFYVKIKSEKGEIDEKQILCFSKNWKFETLPTGTNYRVPDSSLHGKVKSYDCDEEKGLFKINIVYDGYTNGLDIKPFETVLKNAGFEREKDLFLDM